MNAASSIRTGRAVLLAIAGAWLILATAPGTAHSETAAKPDLYFYPPPYVLPDHSTTGGILTLAPEQITTLIPAIPPMTGVVLMVSWSTLCPTAAKCDFSLIDQVLAYWGKRGKKVVLGVETTGLPFKVLDHGAAHFVTVTPDWVLDQIRTFEADTQTAGFIDKSNETHARFPVYSDPRFVRLVAAFIGQLARFDGNPVLAEVRIATGKAGEDNPGGSSIPLSLIPDYTDLGWIDYCRQMTQIFRASFKKTQLEFDMGRVAVHGSDQVNRAGGDFVSDLIDHHTFLAFNGLRDDTFDKLNTPNAGGGIPHILHYLRQAQAHGAGIGLEAFAPMWSDRMQADQIAACVHALKPNRLVFFAEVAAVADQARDGDSPRNAVEMRALTFHGDSAATASRILDLLRQLGYL